MSGTSAEGEYTDGIIEELQSAVRTFQDSLNNIKKRTLRDQGVQSGHLEEGEASPGSSNVRDSEVLRNETDGRASGSDQIAQLVRDGISTTPQTELVFVEDGGLDWNHWLPPNLHQKYTSRLNEHESACRKMINELDHFEKHIKSAGGDEAVALASAVIRSKLSEVAESVRVMLNLSKDVSQVGWGTVMESVYNSLEKLSNSIDEFHTSVYRQRHAFYFRRVSEWKERCNNGLGELNDLKWWEMESAQLISQYIHEQLFPSLEGSMTDVAKELQNFGERSLPMFLSDEKERATTRYLNITTIATFFSSVTATTLQMSLMYQNQPFYSVVNFFWFLSLVFSVSSGVSSLVGMTWRKSSIYHTTKPPWLIRMWLDKAPMIFLIVSALTFILGLNIFAYLSSQIRYVSLSTNVFTGVHSICLFFVVVWFLYRLKYESRPIKRIREMLDEWVFAPYKSEDGLHFRRNVYWAFELDDRVLELTEQIYRGRDWPGPSVIAKCIRSVVHALRMPVRVVVAGTKWIVWRVKRNSNASPADGEMSTEEKAWGEYRRKLEEHFDSSRGTDDVLKTVGIWTEGYWNDDKLKRELDGFFWGYPKLAEYPFSSELAELRRRNLDGREGWFRQLFDPQRRSSIHAHSPSLRGETRSTCQLEPSLGETGHLDGPKSEKSNLELSLHGHSRLLWCGDRVEPDLERMDPPEAAGRKGANSGFSQTVLQSASSPQNHSDDHSNCKRKDSGSAEHVMEFHNAPSPPLSASCAVESNNEVTSNAG